MTKFNRYKVNCSELPELMSREQGNNPPTEKDMAEFFKILEKDMLDVTESQKSFLLDVTRKGITYDNYSLSTSIRKSLYKHYAYARYGISKISLTSDKPLQFEKGEVAEPDAILLLNSLDGVTYQKNEKLFSNKFFKGIPDIILEENEKIAGVKDVKVCIDFPSFLERVDGDCLKDDMWEMRGYLDILGLKEGEICYCLVDMPEQFKQKRLKEHEERMILYGLTKEHIKKRLRQIEKSMIYDYIEPEKRIKRFTVVRKGYFTAQAHKRVKTVRNRLNRLHEKFEGNLITLAENGEESPQSID